MTPGIRVAAPVAALLLLAGALAAEIPRSVLTRLDLAPPVGADRAVARIETDLAWIGLFSGPADGRPDRDLRVAAGRFQSGLGVAPTGRLSAEDRRELARRADLARDGADFRWLSETWTGMRLALPRGLLRAPRIEGDPPFFVVYEGTDAAGLVVELSRFPLALPIGDVVETLARTRREADPPRSIVTSGTDGPFGWIVTQGGGVRTVAVYESGSGEVRGIEARFEAALAGAVTPVLAEIFRGAELFHAAGVAEADIPRRLASGEYPGGSETPEWYRSMVASGSGIIVSRQGHILTNQHVVAACGRLTVNGQPAVLVASDLRTDLALVRSEQFAGRRPVRFRQDEAALGETVHVMGYPVFTRSQSLNLTNGIVSSTVGLFGNRNHIQITAPVQPGNSGGPVLDAAGDLLAVVVSKPSLTLRLEDSIENIAWVIRGSVARDFLTRFGVEPVVASQPRRAATPLAERALNWRRFTVRIECHEN